MPKNTTSNDPILHELGELHRCAMELLEAVKKCGGSGVEGELSTIGAGINHNRRALCTLLGDPTDVETSHPPSSMVEVMAKILDYAGIARVGLQKLSQGDWTPTPDEAQRIVPAVQEFVKEVQETKDRLEKNQTTKDSH